MLETLLIDLLQAFCKHCQNGFVLVFAMFYEASTHLKRKQKWLTSTMLRGDRPQIDSKNKDLGILDEISQAQLKQQEASRLRCEAAVRPVGGVES